MKMIAAVDANFGLGYNNDLLFNIPTDMRFFQTKTKNNIVVMGHNTFKSIKIGPLPNRISLVLKRIQDVTYNSDNLYMGNESFIREKIKELTERYPEKEVYIAGGAQIYNLFIEEAELVYLTQYWKKYENVDTWFPEDKLKALFPKTNHLFLGYHEDYDYIISEWLRN